MLALSRGQLLRLVLGIASAAALKRTAKRLPEIHNGSAAAGVGMRNLVLADVPFNFGLTVSKVAGMGESADWQKQTERYFKLVHSGQNWPDVKAELQPEAELWGALHPDLRQKSPMTKCPWYNTPQVWWPHKLAQRYFGNKTVFGVLRDPYERMVSFHRDSDFYPDCDVNKAVKRTMTNYLAGHIYREGCRFLPQALYFEGPYGITEPIDIRKFPESANAVLERHGYQNMHIRMDDVLRAGGCPNVWAGDLDAETRGMIKQVYKQDFDLLCKHFGYCNPDETVCLSHIPGMCPSGRQPQ